MPELIAWYNKKHLTFSDLFQAVKKELEQLKRPILNSVLNIELGKIDSGEDLSEEYFGAMGF